MEAGPKSMGDGYDTEPSSFGFEAVLAGEDSPAM
jgi:hypothetical protein